MTNSSFRTLLCGLGYLLILLAGCSSSTQYPLVATITLIKPSQTSVPILIPSKTAVPTVMANKSNTPTPSITPTSPTPTAENSIYIQISELPKGKYLLLVGRNDFNDYSYVLISETGQFVYKFRLDYSTEFFSSDLHFIGFSTMDTNARIYWADLEKSIDLLPVAEHCMYMAWSKDNKKLALLCNNGIKFMALDRGSWVDIASLALPEEFKIIPENSNVYPLKYPIWIKDGLLVFTDYTQFSQNWDIPYNIYFVPNNCMEASSKCSLDKPILSIEKGIITAAAISPDDQFLAIAVSTQKNEILIYDLQTKQMVRSLDVSKIEPDEHYPAVDSIVWGNQNDQINFNLAFSSKIFSISNFDTKNWQYFFKCTDYGVHDCVALSWVNLK